MKAIDLLFEFDFDAELAELGMLIRINADHFIDHWFGEDAKLKRGDIEIEKDGAIYYVIWESNDRTWYFKEKFKPDAEVKTNEDTIYLFKITGYEE